MDNGQQVSVNAKSLWAFCEPDWNDIWCESENDIYSSISKFSAE